jgi:hypothetical protein
MAPQALFDNSANNTDNRISLGNGLAIELLGGQGKKFTKAILYRYGVMVKDFNSRDRVAKRLFIVDAVTLGAKKSYLAEALGISRQTIDNHLESQECFGKEGLIHGYKLADGTNRIKQRKLHKVELCTGNKAQLVAEIRAKKRRDELKDQTYTPALDFSGGSNETITEIDPGDQPFAEEHPWEATRYAGVFPYLIALISQYGWLRFIMSRFAGTYRILMAFVFMVSINIRSIEQLKHVLSREAGVILGIRRLGSRSLIWESFYNAARLKKSGALLNDFFQFQIKSGLVGITLWFTDGHLLPYSGKHHMHYAYNTQRRMPVPGRTAMVTCDISGRIVAFDIQEGKGDLRARIADLGKKWQSDMPQKAVQVFDREGHGADFFASLVLDQSPFVTWEKNVDAKKMEAIADDKYISEFELNGKFYGVFEENKSVEYVEKKMAGTEQEIGDDENKGGDDNKKSMILRHIFLWNKTSKRRTCGLAWTGDIEMTTEDCARAILCRWGASENTFKHLKDRHPLHYHPGFKLIESERQDIANPEIKEKESAIKTVKTILQKLYRKFSQAKEMVNSDGVPRKNSIKEKNRQAIDKNEADLSRLSEQRKELPDRVDVSSLVDYKSFKQVDNEGKYLFDFVTISVWNARKQMIEWLSPYFNEKDELVDLFYAITKCHGWIKSTKTEVTVRLEPLQQARHRNAQIQLCRRLTSFMACTPNGKRLTVEVGEAPV